MSPRTLALAAGLLLVACADDPASPDAGPRGTWVATELVVTRPDERIDFIADGMSVRLELRDAGVAVREICFCPVAVDSGGWSHDDGELLLDFAGQGGSFVQKALNGMSYRVTADSIVGEARLSGADVVVIFVPEPSQRS